MSNEATRESEAIKVTFCPTCTTPQDMDPEAVDAGDPHECATCGTEFWPEVDEPSFHGAGKQPENDEPFTGAILLCPSCQESLDAAGWGIHIYTCAECDQSFAVDLEPHRVREHSMFG